MTFGTVAILGPGLIGGSIALALSERGLAERLTIYARKETSFDAIRKKAGQAHLTTDPAEAVRDADIVILCVPVETMAGLMKQFAHALKPTALVTDVGSVKESVDKELSALLQGKALWIGSHPMAGSEKAGFAVARPDLFVGAKVILTPTEKTSPEARERAETFWGKLGGKVLSIPPAEHDLFVAHVSHLPHLAAVALINAAHEDHFQAVGPGFRDTTRVASGSPELWTEILLDNRKKIATSLKAIIAELDQLKESLEKSDKTGLREILQKAHDQRSKLFHP